MTMDTHLSQLKPLVVYGGHIYTISIPLSKLSIVLYFQFIILVKTFNLYNFEIMHFWSPTYFQMLNLNISTLDIVIKTHSWN